MIKKIVEIQNVGVIKKFEKHNWSSGEFSKNNIVIAENGQGKTTLSTIISSLCNQEPDLILGRKTIGELDPQSVKVRLDSGFAEFKNNVWSTTCENIEVFNNEFVHDNLYVGNQINNEHKKNLLSFAIGQSGVTINHRIIELEDMIKEMNTGDIKSCKSELNAYIKQSQLGLSLEEFFSMEQIEDIEAKIIKEEVELRNIRETEKIKMIESLRNLGFEMPKVEILNEIMGASLCDISNEVEKKVLKRAKLLNEERGLQWIETGIEMLKSTDAACPFCGLEIDGNDLVKSYKDYFSEEYNKFKTILNSNLKALKNNTSEYHCQRILGEIQNNVRLVERWASYMDIDDEILKVIKSNIDIFGISKNVHKLIDEKEKNKLAIMEVDKPIAESIEKLHEFLDHYNSTISIVNKQIQEFKDGLSIKPLNDKKLRNLRLNKTRFSKEVLNTISKYDSLLERKDRIVVEKRGLKGELNSINETTMSQYAERINRLLRNFGASFKIREFRPNYQGGPKLDYSIEIKGATIPLIDKDNKKPQFRNTLSEGDKSTLAFAFYLSRLMSMNEESLREKVVVVDDPISSLDLHRITTTAKELSLLSEKVKQLIVLTHNTNFAKKLFDSLNKTPKPLILEIKRGKFCKVDNPDRINMSEYFINYEKLKRYSEGDSLVDDLEALKCIRPLLESHLRMHYPDEFPAGKWLGDFIKTMEDNTSSFSSFVNTERLAELNELKDYTSPFHHGNTFSQDDIREQEVLAYVGRALEFIKH